MANGLTIKATRAYRAWLDGQPLISIEMAEPMTLAELLDHLARSRKAFPSLPVHDRTSLQAEVLIYDGRCFLSPEDQVQPGGELELLPPTAGG